MKSLTNEDVLDFKKDGFLIKRGFFTDNKIIEIGKLIDEYKNISQSDLEGKENLYY
mgnify:FL=1